jgi:hypothetical protein
MGTYGVGPWLAALAHDVSSAPSAAVMRFFIASRPKTKRTPSSSERSTLYEGVYHEAMGAAPQPLARTRRACDGVVIWRVGGYRIGARSLRYCDGRYVQISPTFGRTCSVLLNGSRAP